MHTPFGPPEGPLTRLISENGDIRWYEVDKVPVGHRRETHPDLLPEAIRQFAIVATPRSGSTLLCALLASHPSVVCHYEALHPDHVDIEVPNRPYLLKDVALRDRSQSAFIHDLVWHSAAESPAARAIGFKILLSPLQMKEGYKAIMQDRGCLKILLDRPNRFEGYRSWKNSMLTGQWRVEPGVDPISVPLQFDKAEFLKYMKDTDASVDDARTRLMGQPEFHGRPTLELTYDDVVAGDGVNRVLAELGVPNDAPLTSPWRPMNPTPAVGAFFNQTSAVDALRQIGRLDWLDEGPQQTGPTV